MPTKKRMNHCGSTEHTMLTRRSFLGTSAALAGGMTGIGGLSNPAVADEIKKKDKRVIMLWLAGGASQLETWDPKPGRPTGGPFMPIETATSGVRISELMPKMASRLSKHTAIIRSLNTRDGGHGGGADLMMHGRRNEPNLKYPDLGAMLAHELGQADSQVPDYVAFYSQTEGRSNGGLGPGFLGSRYAPIKLHEKMELPFVKRLESISEIDHRERADLRKLLSNRFTKGRQSSTVGSHNTAYDRVSGLMASDKLFDISQEPQKVRDRYGPTLFGQQALIARRLVEAGVPFVRVARAWWDSHGQNFETHSELVPEFDHVLSTLLDDLGERGLLENTLVITTAEFGRTPKINGSLGRDHFATAWSSTLSGCGILPGAVYGETDADGNTVKDGEIGAGEFFATIFEALGIKHNHELHVGARPIPMVNPGIKPIREVLA
jgi:hypothetical protein